MGIQLSITKRFTFSASHSLPNHDGKCKENHGHNYILYVTITGETQKSGPKKGMIVDYGDIKKIVKELVVDKFDHKNLNNIFGDLPTTAENLALQILVMLESEKFGDGRVTEIKLHETESSFATATVIN
ncbi:MAG: 6-carboxytetrahydropterin synthase QueD [Candidatus Nomurabacteria bacterium]|nr:6-carboxytetrahydropterin synthase QueD [Candidatus Nomurabacteria bacterium]